LFSRPLIPTWLTMATSAKTAKTEIWLPFLDTYRTMCCAPEPAFRRILEDIRDLPFGA